MQRQTGFDMEEAGIAGPSAADRPVTDHYYLNQQYEVKENHGMASTLNLAKQYISKKKKI